MNILKNRTVLGLICIVLSLIICFGLTPMFNRAVTAQVEIVRVVRNIRPGEMITADMVTTVKVGGHNLPSDVLRQTENAVGRYSLYGLRAGDYILSGKLSDAPIAQFAYLHDLDGTQEAISITIKSFAAGLSGKLEAGDIISVIATDFGDFRATVAPPELRYVQVLAVTDSKGNDAEPNTHSRNDEDRELPSTVTLLVYPEQAIILAELEARGRIHFTLVFRGSEENRDKFLQAQSEFIFPPEDEEAETPKYPEDYPEYETEGEPVTVETQEENKPGRVVIYRADGTEVVFDGQ